MDSEVGPLEATLPHDTTGLPDDLLLPLQEKARRLGLWSLSTPAEFGGAGLGVLGQAVVAEEAAKCRMGAYLPGPGRVRRKPAERDVQRFARAVREVRRAADRGASGQGVHRDQRGLGRVRPGPRDPVPG